MNWDVTLEFLSICFPVYVLLAGVCLGQRGKELVASELVFVFDTKVHFDLLVLQYVTAPIVFVRTVHLGSMQIINKIR